MNTHYMGLYLVQWLSSEIKLRIHAALDMTKYPNRPVQVGYGQILLKEP